jgi:hypothetical protein
MKCDLVLQHIRIIIIIIISKTALCEPQPSLERSARLAYSVVN